MESNASYGGLSVDQQSTAESTPLVDKQRGPILIIAATTQEWVSMLSVGATAAATLVLAIVTYAYMRLTRKIAASANRSAEASEQAAAAAAESVQLTRNILLLESIPFVTGVEVQRNGEDWTLVLANAGGGTAINPEAWIEVEGTSFTIGEDRIIPHARYPGPIVKGDSVEVKAKGPAIIADGTDVAVVARYSDKAGGSWTTKNHRFGPIAGQIDSHASAAGGSGHSNSPR